MRHPKDRASDKRIGRADSSTSPIRAPNASQQELQAAFCPGLAHRTIPSQTPVRCGRDYPNRGLIMVPVRFTHAIVGPRWGRIGTWMENLSNTLGDVSAFVRHRRCGCCARPGGAAGRRRGGIQCAPRGRPRSPVATSSPSRTRCVSPPSARERAATAPRPAAAGTCGSTSYPPRPPPPTASLGDEAGDREREPRPPGSSNCLAASRPCTLGVKR